MQISVALITNLLEHRVASFFLRSLYIPDMKCPMNTNTTLG